MNTLTNLEQLLATVDAADPPPWIAEDGDVWRREDGTGYSVELLDEHGAFYSPTNAALIVALRNNAALLIEAAKAAERWREHHERGGRPAGSREALERWYREEPVVNEALCAALVPLTAETEEERWLR